MDTITPIIHVVPDTGDLLRRVATRETHYANGVTLTEYLVHRETDPGACAPEWITAADWHQTDPPSNTTEWARCLGFELECDAPDPHVVRRLFAQLSDGIHAELAFLEGADR